jgi:hypothetical protein
MAGSKKVLAIFGATGQQGGALAAYVLSDPELSASYAVRAITRDVTSSKVANLRHQGAEVVPGDISDVVSLESALKGVQTVFIMTTHAWGPNAVEVEFGQVKNAADTAVALGVEYVIFSTLPHTSQISGGKYAKVTFIPYSIGNLKQYCLCGLSNMYKVTPFDATPRRRSTSAVCPSSPPSTHLALSWKTSTTTASSSAVPRRTGL